MQTKELSNYLNDRITQVQEERYSVDTQAQAAHEASVRALEDRLDRNRDDVRQAWRYGRPLALINSGCKLALNSLAPNPEAPLPTEPSREEKILVAGEDGELNVLNALEDSLDDSWTALTGYKANGGDVDIILVGPGGIYAIEVKHFNKRVNCDGDEWWCDRWGTREDLANKAGRTPSRQLNSNIRPLRNYLKKCGNRTDIRRMIVLSHHESEIGTISNKRVDDILVLGEWDIERWMASQPQLPSSFSTSITVKQIRQSHDYWHEKQRRRNQRLTQSTSSDIGSKAIEADCQDISERPIAEGSGDENVVVAMPDHVLDAYETRKTERESRPGAYCSHPDLMFLWKSRELSERNRWIWEAGAFDHLSDKPSLLKGSRRKRF